MTVTQTRDAVNLKLSATWPCRDRDCHFMSKSLRCEFLPRPLLDARRDMPVVDAPIIVRSITTPLCSAFSPTRATTSSSTGTVYTFEHCSDESHGIVRRNQPLSIHYMMFGAQYISTAANRWFELIEAEDAPPARTSRCDNLTSLSPSMKFFTPFRCGKHYHQCCPFLLPSTFSSYPQVVLAELSQVPWRTGSSVGGSSLLYRRCILE